MELSAEGLAFSLMFTPPDGEGWMYCNVIVNAPGFREDLDCNLQLADLERFRSQLVHALEPAHWPCDVRLCGLEPGIDVSFRVEGTGQIAGRYMFQKNSAGEAALSGAFRMDQTFLRPLLQQVDDVLRVLAVSAPIAGGNHPSCPA